MSDSWGAVQKYKAGFESHIGDFNDLAWFSKVFETKLLNEDELSSNLLINQNTTKVDLNTIVESKSKLEKEDLESKIYKWRSAETNLKLILESQNGAKVTDVSKNNLGYDLEVNKNGIINYIEIKSVENFGKSIALTSNEYATASEAKDKYILALVKQTNTGINVVFIPNPTENLSFNKRVTRWEWSCDEFPSLEVINYNYE